MSKFNELGFWLSGAINDLGLLNCPVDKSKSLFGRNNGFCGNHNSETTTSLVVTHIAAGEFGMRIEEHVEVGIKNTSNKRLLEWEDLIYSCFFLYSSRLSESGNSF